MVPSASIKGHFQTAVVVITPAALMDRDTAQTLVPPELLDPVVAYFRPRRVILFGSHARGESGPDSDIDLLVLLDDDAPPEKLTYRAGMEARRSYNAAVDVIACREDTYRRFNKIVGTLEYAARTEGVVVYDQG